MTDNGTPSSAHRRARTDFIKAHHPDRGGDSATFVAGLASFDGTSASPITDQAVTIAVHRRRGPVGHLITTVARRRHKRTHPRVR